MKSIEEINWKKLREVGMIGEGPELTVPYINEWVKISENLRNLRTAQFIIFIIIFIHLNIFIREFLFNKFHVAKPLIKQNFH